MLEEPLSFHLKCCLMYTCIHTIFIPNHSSCNYIHIIIYLPIQFKIAQLAVKNLDFLCNGICCRAWSTESRTKNLILMRHLVAEILNVKVREVDNFGKNFSSFFPKVQLPIWWLIMHKIENKSL